MSSKELPGNVPGRPGVQYGLIMPGKQSKPTTVPVVRKKPSIFNQSDSDSDVEGKIYLHCIANYSIKRKKDGWLVGWLNN